MNFNEEIVVVDMNTFSLPAVWGFSSIGASVFHTTQVAMNAGNQSITLTGNFLSDFLVMGDTIVVTFFYVPAMGVTDKAGNAFNATINFATGWSQHRKLIISPVICYYRAYYTLLSS